MRKIKTFKFKKPINLYCFTDVHIGSEAFDRKKFEKAISILKKDKDGYCFFNGDNLEFTPGGYHGATNHQLMDIDSQIRYFSELVKSLKDKVLFFRTGNHENRARILTDVDVYSHLSRELDIYNAHVGMEEMHIYVKNRKYRIVSTHGEGGSSKTTLNNMKLTFPGADVYFTGHTHEMIANIGNMNIKTDQGFEEFRNQIEIVGGSFSGWAEYARSKNMAPKQTGCYILSFGEDVRIKGEIR